MNWAFYSRIFRIALISVAVLALVYLVLPTFVIVPLSFSSTTYLSFPPPGWSVPWPGAISARP